MLQIPQRGKDEECVLALFLFAAPLPRFPLLALPSLTPMIAPGRTLDSGVISEYAAQAE